MGTSSPPSSREAGTVYFRAHDNNDSGYGTIYYDDANGKRKEIIPTSLDCGTFISYFDDCCFFPGTKILMADYSTKDIEKINSGDEVLSFDIFTQKFYPTKVNRLIINKYTINLATIYFEDGTELNMNEYHPILTSDGFHSLTNHNNYKTLKIGDFAKTLTGYNKIVNIYQYQSKRPIITYNLDTINFNEVIDDDSNDTFIANGIVVHNAACPT